MTKFDELLKELNELKLIQKNMDWKEDIPAKIYDIHFKNNSNVVAEGLDVDTHRWYECSTNVYEIYGKYLGVNSVTNLFSESMDVEDCYAELSFFEMEPVTTITYKQLEDE